MTPDNEKFFVLRYISALDTVCAYFETLEFATFRIMGGNDSQRALQDDGLPYSMEALCLRDQAATGDDISLFPITRQGISDFLAACTKVHMNAPALYLIFLYTDHSEEGENDAF